MSRDTIETDVLVIGTGPAGATFARLLGAQGRSVLMVDAGPQLRKRPGEHLLNCYRYQLQPNLSLDEMFAHREPYSVPGVPHDVTTLAPTRRASAGYNPPLERLNFQNPEQNPSLNMPNASIMYAVGGMFSLWSGFAPDPAPMERTPLIPAEDWEVALAIARRLLNVHTDAFQPSAVSRAIRGVLAQHGRAMDDSPMGAEKRGVDTQVAHLVTWTGSDTILGPLLDADGLPRPGFGILEQHRAEQLLLRNPGGAPHLALGGGHVEGVVVRDLRTFETRTIAAETVVVACGPFLTPRLLWQSNIRPAALGRFIQDNPVATCQLLLNQTVVAALRADAANPARHDVVPIAWNDAPPKCGFGPTPDQPWRCEINHAGGVPAYDLSFDVRLTVDLTWYSMIEPAWENRVVFSDRHLDRFGQPQPTFEFRLGAGDAHEAGRALDDLAQVAPLIGAYVPLTRPPFTVGPTLQPMGTSLHLMSTYRMGTDPETSVVDPDCKVWGIDNLYLAGGGVIPNKVASNCTLTICAIAARAASKLLGRPLDAVERETAPTPSATPAGGGPPPATSR